MKTPKITLKSFYLMQRINARMSQNITGTSFLQHSFKLAKSEKNKYRFLDMFSHKIASKLETV